MDSPKRPSLPAIFALTAILFLTGCIAALPVPNFSTKPYSGKVISSRDARFIVPRKTTRAEVVRVLGQGYRESLWAPAMAYGWELPGISYVSWAIIWIPWYPPLTGSAKGELTTRARALFLQFDAAGVVLRKEFVRLKSSLTIDQQLNVWAGAAPPRNPPQLLP